MTASSRWVQRAGALRAATRLGLPRHGVSASAGDRVKRWKRSVAVPKLSAHWLSITKAGAVASVVPWTTRKVGQRIAFPHSAESRCADASWILMIAVLIA